jgi:hypothetical protein
MVITLAPNGFGADSTRSIEKAGVIAARITRRDATKVLEREIEPSPGPKGAEVGCRSRWPGRGRCRFAPPASS